MDIQILQLVEGARAARGTAVIIDVFRAFTVETWMFRRNARKVIPMGSLEEAFAYRRAHPDTLLCGERGGAMVPGFDFGNSPSQLEHADLTGKTLVHTTGAGTQGIANAVNAREILTGSLVNAGAVAQYIRMTRPEQVSLVCMGLNCLRPIEEDTLCARYIQSLLEDRPLPDMAQRIESLKHTSGAKFFDPAQQSVFPQRDFVLCTQLDTVPFVLRYVPGRPGYMERVMLPE